MLRKTVLVRALSIAFSAAALSAAVMAPAMAQSNASGIIYGRVDSPSGATVVMNNTDTGLKRVMTPDASGRFQATALPAGHYRVDLVRSGSVVSSTETDVIIGQGVEATFASAAEVTKVQVTGRRSRIDVSSATNGATFTAKELAALPIAQNVAAIIQLAPNTTRSDPRYAAGSSIGGGGASENAYYINGFPVTNPLTQLGASELPFGAIAQAQVLTGGFGAEFGRSVGGVVNITTKSGTNTWETGATFSEEPNALRSKAKNVFFSHTGDPSNAKTDGTLYARNDLDYSQSYRYGAYLGGPIIQDKLFMFIAAEEVDRRANGVSGVSNASALSNSQAGWYTRSDNTKRYMGKLDWNITDNHRLEFSSIGDKPVSDISSSDYNYTTGIHAGNVSKSAHYENIAGETPTTGSVTNILKYTGNLTDNLTLSVLTGKMTTDHVAALVGNSQSIPGVVFSSLTMVPGLAYNSPNPWSGLTIGSPISQDVVKSTRVDLEWKVGSHTIRAGGDDNKMSSFGAGDVTAGGFTWRYLNTATPANSHSLTGVPVIIANGGGFGPQGYYVLKQDFHDVTSAYSNQSAQYIEDKWQVTKDVLVTPGLRLEQYKNKNGDGEDFLTVKNQYNPRLSVAWDVNGDSSLKVFGSAGRYSIQIPTHVAIRGASRSTYERQYFTYTGVAADGQPTGLNPLTPVVSPDNEFGQAKLAATVSAQNLKPSYQDEVTLGFERAFSPALNFGAKITYRKLRSTIDDFCDGRPFDTWAAAHNVDETNYGGFNCASINPGETNNFLVDYSGTGKNLTPVTLTAKDMGFDKPVRIYKALDLFAEHPFRNGWYGRVNYTWSRSTGNTEGQTLSAVAQTDVAATQTWDMREIMEYANGLLPNDREHQIKAFGYLEVTPQFSVGGNLLVASGQPETCLGNYPGTLAAADPGFPDYGSAYHYCFGGAGAKDNPPSPGGSAGRLPWDVRLDMDLVFKPVQVKGLQLKMDVFNVFNKQTVQQIDQTYNTTGGGINPTFGTPGAFVGYTSPRSVKFSVQYDHKF